jgi:hypothetical protein
MIKHNKLKVITLHAYDAQGNVVDLLTTQTNMNPELVYLEFETVAMRDYKAIRFTMEVAYVLLILFLSSCFGAQRVEAHSDYRDGLYSDVRILELHNSWISGASCYCGTGTTDPFVSENPPVRYLWVWPRLPTTLDTLRANARKELAMLMSKPAEPLPVFVVNWKAVGTVLLGLGIFIVFECMYQAVFQQAKRLSRLR